MATFAVTAAQIEEAQQLRDVMPFWQHTNELFMEAKRAFPSNTDLTAVLLKATLIDRLYATNVFAIFQAAQHIVSVLSAPTNIPQGPALVMCLAEMTVGGKPRKVTSFAAKYAHFFLDGRLPIMDSYAAQALCLHLGLPQARVETWQQNYALYCKAIKELQTLTKFNITDDQLDTYLWLGGLSIQWLKKGEQAEINSEAKQAFKAASESQLQRAFGPLWERARK